MKQHTLKLLALTALLGTGTVLPKHQAQDHAQQSLKTKVIGYLRHGQTKGQQLLNWSSEKIQQIHAKNLLNQAKTPFRISTYQPLLNKQTYLNNPGKTFTVLLGGTIAVLAIYHRWSKIAKWFEHSRFNLYRMMAIKRYSQLSARVKNACFDQLKKYQYIQNDNDAQKTKELIGCVFDKYYFNANEIKDQTTSTIKIGIENLKAILADTDKDFTQLDPVKSTFKKLVDAVGTEIEINKVVDDIKEKTAKESVKSDDSKNKEIDLSEQDDNKDDSGKEENNEKKIKVQSDAQLDENNQDTAQNNSGNSSDEEVGKTQQNNLRKELKAQEGELNNPSDVSTTMHKDIQETDENLQQQEIGDDKVDETTEDESDKNIASDSDNEDKKKKE